MKVTYETEIPTMCPEDGEGDIYRVSFESWRAILVEDIKTAIEDATSGPYRDPPQRPRFQEEMTDFLSRRLTCKVTSIGYHSGVKTTVTCP